MFRCAATSKKPFRSCEKGIPLFGGFITESDSNEKKDVPIRKDTPELGSLFRSAVKSSSRGELIILTKSTFLEPPEQGAFLAQCECATLPGVHEAKTEENKVDRKCDRGFLKKERIKPNSQF